MFNVKKLILGLVLIGGLQTTRPASTFLGNAANGLISTVTKNALSIAVGTLTLGGGTVAIVRERRNKQDTIQELEEEIATMLQEIEKIIGDEQNSLPEADVNPLQATVEEQRKLIAGLTIERDRAIQQAKVTEKIAALEAEVSVLKEQRLIDEMTTLFAELDEEWTRIQKENVDV